jgi:pimeloyl-ACP methyl ester carboxylesterase
MDSLPLGSHNDILPGHLRIGERTFRVASSCGVIVAVTDWGYGEDDPRPVLMMSHATGLHGHAWLPVVVALSSHFHCIAVDQRGQGDSTSPTVDGFGWRGLGDDLEVAMGALGLLGNTELGNNSRPVYGIGHSQGGYCMLEVERRRPGTFTSLFVYEPVVFAPPAPPAGTGPGTGTGTGTGTAVSEPTEQDNFMAMLAAKRRREFPSWQAAVDNFRGKGPFVQADEDLIRAYVYWGFKEKADGSAIELKCAPEDEAALFRGSQTNLMNHAESIACPVTVAVGSLTNEGFATFNPILAERLRNGRLLKMEGRTHFGIFEGVPEMAEIVTQSLLGL